MLIIVWIRYSSDLQYSGTADLSDLARALNYDFNSVQLKRGVYYPQGQAVDSLARALIRDNLLKVLQGTQAVKMEVVSLPVTEEAMKNKKMFKMLF